MVSHEERRLSRLHTIKASIKKAGKNLNKEKLISVCMMEWGSSRRTILEYIKVVETCNE